MDRLHVACRKHDRSAFESRMDSRLAMSPHRAGRKNMPSLHMISDVQNKRGESPLEEATLTFTCVFNNFSRFYGAHYLPVKSLPRRHIAPSLTIIRLSLLSQLRCRGRITDKLDKCIAL